MTASRTESTPPDNSDGQAGSIAYRPDWKSVSERGDDTGTGVRVTARIFRTGAGEIHHEYCVGGTIYDSLADIQSELGNA